MSIMIDQDLKPTQIYLFRNTMVELDDDKQVTSVKIYT